MSRPRDVKAAVEFIGPVIAGRMLGVSPPTVREWCDRGRLAHYIDPESKRLRISRSAVEALRRQCDEQPVQYDDTLAPFDQVLRRLAGEAHRLGLQHTHACDAILNAGAEFERCGVAGAVPRAFRFSEKLRSATYMPGVLPGTNNLVWFVSYGDGVWRPLAADIARGDQE